MNWDDELTIHMNSREYPDYDIRDIRKFLSKMFDIRPTSIIRKYAELDKYGVFKQNIERALSILPIELIIIVTQYLLLSESQCLGIIFDLGGQGSRSIKSRENADMYYYMTIFGTENKNEFHISFDYLPRIYNPIASVSLTDLFPGDRLMNVKIPTGYQKALDHYRDVYVHYIEKEIDFYIDCC